MPELILAIHSGPHDSVAALFEDYDLKAAVQLERLTRIKGDGSKHPDACIDEVLAIAGATRADVDVISMSRTLLDVKYFRRVTGMRRLMEACPAGKPRPKPSIHDARDASLSFQKS